MENVITHRIEWSTDMTTKIKYIFINGDVLEVEAEDHFAAYILMDRVHEESSDRKERRHNYKIEAMHYEDERFASQWGNPEKLVIAHEEYEALSKTLEGLTSTQKRRLILRLLGISYREIASQEKVNVKSVFESIEGIRKKLQEIKNYTIDE